MMAALKRLTTRIDDMTLRERGLLIGAASLILIAAAYVSLIDPVLGRQKVLIEQAKRDRSQLAAVRGELGKFLLERQAIEQQPEQQALRELERRLAAIEQTLARKQRDFVGPERLQTLLRDLLGSGRAVKLESLRVLPGVAVEDTAPPTQKPAAQKPPAAAQTPAAPALHRHGVEVVLRGSYFDLVQYLDELEKLPARLLWGRVELQADPYPEVKLTVTVYTLTPQRSLLGPPADRKAD